MSVSLSLVMFFAAVAHADTQPPLKTVFYCNATCVSVDLAASAIDALGEVEGESDYSSIEAYQLMRAGCEWRLEAAGLKRDKNTMLTLAKSLSYMRRTASGGSASWEKAGSLELGRYWYARSQSTSQSMSFYREDESRIELEFARAADETVCGEFRVNPNGRQKYKGSEPPMG